MASASWSILSCQSLPSRLRPTAAPPSSGPCPAASAAPVRPRHTSPATPRAAAACQSRQSPAGARPCPCRCRRSPATAPYRPQPQPDPRWFARRPRPRAGSCGCESYRRRQSPAGRPSPPASGPWSCCPLDGSPSAVWIICGVSGAAFQAKIRSHRVNQYGCAHGPGAESARKGVLLKCDRRRNQ